MMSRWALNIFGGLLFLSSWSCTKEQSLPDVTVIGHAGTSIYPGRSPFPPNTVAAVEYALDVLDADGVEVDIQMTKDSVLVLYHDENLSTHTDSEGCVQEKNFSEIQHLTIDGSKYKLATLEEIMTICQQRNKLLFLDIKTFNYCTASDVDYNTFNSAMNAFLAPYTYTEKSRLTINTRRYELFLVLTDNSAARSFETEDIDLGISIVQSGISGELCINQTAITVEIAKKLRDLNIPFTVFGPKTPQEIRNAVNYLPSKIITDNIAYTRKKSK
jgi:glycerophosphoryl diester phosphodiesterase